MTIRSVNSVPDKAGTVYRDYDLTSRSVNSVPDKVGTVYRDNDLTIRSVNSVPDKAGTVFRFSVSKARLPPLFIKLKIWAF